MELNVGMCLGAGICAYPRSENADLHPTDINLSVGTPAWGTRLISRTTYSSACRYPAGASSGSYTVTLMLSLMPAKSPVTTTVPDRSA